MISFLEINNFKSHKKTPIEFKNLTVLCGGNSVGKSSIIQSLLLLREAYINKSNFEYLDLLSNPVKIGTVADAIYQYSESNEISFNLHCEDEKYNFLFEINDNDYTKTLINAKKDSFKTIIINKDESLFNENFQFISSARLGPQPFYPKDDVIVDKYKQISVIEGKAEYSIHFLHKNQSKKVIKELVNPNTSFDDLLNQVVAWEKEISKGINLLINDNGKLGFELKFQYETQKGNKRTNEFSPQNVGFGVTYVLPILIAILSAQPGTLLIIENPEAHLHPKGISKLTQLICLASEAGIQIIVETHSDHLINGILVQSKMFESSGNGINRNNVGIYQFDLDFDEHFTKTQKIEIEEEGLIRYTPQGFFDQFTIDRRYLIGF